MSYEPNKMTHYWYKLFTHRIIIVFCCALFGSVAFAEPNLEGIQIYKKNIHLAPEREGLAEDISRYHNADDLWDVLRQQFTLPHYEDDPLVQNQIEWFMNHQDFLMRSASRAAPYLYYIMQQAKKRNLPAEVVLLPIFESSFDPFAYSPAGAAGIWQMMPNTATGYGIKQDWWYDGRRDVIASTKAALNYLTYLGTFFENNWLLSIAAYDTGEGNVMSAIRRNIRDGRNTDYWSLPLAQETREYVPRLLALAIIISHPEKYPVYLPPVRNAPYLAQMDVGGQMDLKHAANLAGMTLKKLMQLNPGFNRASTSPNGPYKIVLPIESVAQFSENLASAPVYQRVGWQHYKVKSGDTMASLANRFNTSEAVLRQLNKLSSNSLRPGANLVIPHSVPALSKSIIEAENQPVYIGSTEIAPKKAPRKSLASRVAASFAPSKNLVNAMRTIHGEYSIQPGDTIYMTRQGDTIQQIANHFRIPTEALIASNPIDDNGIHAGEKLVIPTHLINRQVARVDDMQPLDNKPQYQLAPGDTIYTVRTGDNMEKIAKKFHTTPPAIRVSNLLANDDLREGDRILIPARI
jgi:membrane-bound lytic murein transglycosylase D